MEMLAPKIYWLLTWAYLPQLIITNYNANFCKKLVLISVRRKFNRVTTSVTSLDHNQIECKILQQTGVDISEKKIQSCHHQWWRDWISSSLLSTPVSYKILHIVGSNCYDQLTEVALQQKKWSDKTENKWEKTGKKWCLSSRMWEVWIQLTWILRKWHGQRQI